MSDRTGMAMGRLRPVIYLENASGHILLLPEEIGMGTAPARRMYEERYKHQGYDWREAGTLNEIDSLQQRMVAQETKELQHQANTMDRVSEAAHKRTASSLYQRMISSDCSPMERDMIRCWLDMQAAKKSKWQAHVQNTISYLWARENDERTRVEDRMGE